ncbi:MAG: gliding motility-associated C-terminal domain-containing protein [Flavobacteriales bacterium]
MGTWTLVSGTGTITNPNSPSSTVTVLSVGANRFRWTINNGPCGTPTQSEVVVTVFSNLQGAANAGPDQAICTPAGSVTLTGNALIGPATGTWTRVSGSGTITTPNSATTTVTGLPVGVHVFRWTISNGPCTNPNTSDDMVVTVYSASSPNADAGPDQQICTPGTSTLAGNTPTFPATGQWTLVSGSGTIANPTSPTSSVTGMGIGTNVFQWTVNNGPCANGVTSDQVSITVFNSTLLGANAGPDQNVCSTTTSVTMAANAPLAPATGTWTRVSGSGTITTPGSATTTITGLAVGENVFRWTLSNGPCPLNPASDLVSIFVYDANAPVANAGPDQAICTPTTTATLAGNTPTFPATGTWTRVSGSGTITDPTNPTSSVTGLAVGTNVFRWTINNGPCANPTSNSVVSIVVFSASTPVANAGSDQDLCTPNTSTTLAGSSVTAPATGTWTLVSGSGTIVSPNSPNTQVTGLGVGNNVFRWTVSNGPCANSTTTADVRVRVFNANNPVANAGPNQSICSTTSSVTLAGSTVIAPATGQWTVISGTGTFSNVNSPTSSVSGLSLGDNVFQWNVSNGPCANGNTTSRVTITVFNSTVGAPDAGPDQAICIPTVSNIVTMAASAVTAPATGVWTLVSGSGTITDPNSPTTTISNMGVGVNVFRWTISNGPCTLPVNSDQVSVSVFSAAMPPANAGPDQSVCTPITQATLAGSTVIAPGTGTWTVVSGTGTFVDAHDPTTVVNGLSLGNNVFRWTVSNGPCAVGSTSDDVTVQLFNGSAQQANAGADQSLCSTSTTTTLAGNPAVLPATGSWTVVSGTATITNPTSATSGVTGLGVGVTTLAWTIDNGACGNSTDQMTITVYNSANPAANAGPDQNLCTPNTSTSLAGSNILAPAVGTWTLVSGSGNIVAPNSPTSQVTNLGVGTNVFRWTVNNGPCPNGTTTDEVSIVVFSNGAAAANAGPDQSICTPTSTVTLAGNTVAAPAVGTWTRVSGSGTITSPNAANTTITGLGVGTNVFRWTVDNGSCGNTQDEVSILVFDANNPVANAGPAQELCLPTTTATMAGSTITAPATGVWTLVSGSGTITDPNSPTTTITGLAVGVNRFRWTVSNGPCADPLTTSDVTVTIFDNTINGANAGPDQELCTPNTTATMAANAAPAPAQGTWTLVSGSGTIGDIHSATTLITNLAVGENVFRWILSNGPCPLNPPTDLVSIFVYDANAMPANAGPDQELCTPITSTTLAASAAVFPGVGTWTVARGTATFADIHSATTAVSGLSQGENVLVWTVDNGPCANPLTTDRVSIFVFDSNNPVANAGPDRSFCTPDVNTTMAGSVPTFPATGTWTRISGTGTITDPSDPATTITGMGVGENIFRWTVSNGPCESGTSFDEVSLFVFDANNATANAGPDQELCAPASGTTLAGSAVTFPATGTWTLVSGTGMIANANDPHTAITGLTIGENVFRWTVDNGPCESGISFDEVSIFVFDPNNPVANAGPDQAFCTPTSATALAGSNVTFPAVGTWTLVSGTGTITDPHDPASGVSDLVVGVNVFVWTVYNGPCADGLTTDTVRVILFDSRGLAANAGPDQDICTPVTSATMAASAATAPAVGTWTVVRGTGNFADPHDRNTTITGLTVGENVFRWTVDNGPCENGTSFDEVMVRLFNDANPVANAGPDQEICTPINLVTLQGSNVIFPAVGTWTIVSGDGTIADANDPNTQVTGLGVGVHVFAWTVDNGPCTNPLTTDTVTITVYDANSPVANAGNDQQVCTPLTSATLGGSGLIPPATGTWTLVSGSGTIVSPHDPNSIVTGLGIGENVFEWTVYNGPCSGVTVDQVSVFLFDLNAPPATAGPDQSYCTPMSSVTLTGNTPTGAAIGTWTLAQGTGTFTDVNDPIATIDGLTVGENIAVWTIDNGVCGISSDSLSIFIFDENNPPASVGPDQEYCTPQDSTFLTGNTPIFPATGTWTVIDGAGLFADVHDPNSKVVGMAIGANTFVWTTNNGPCPDAITSDTLTVIIYSDSTAAANAGPDQSSCLPVNTVQMDASVPQAPATGTWSLVSGSGTIVDPSDPHTVVNDIGVGINVFVWNLDNGPCPNNGILSDTMTVTMYDPAGPAADAGPDQEFCLPEDSTVMTGNTPLFPGVGTWTVISGSATIADIHDPATAITDLAVGDNVFIYSIFNGDCPFAPPTTTDTMHIRVYDPSAAPASAGPDQQLCLPATTATLAGNAATEPGIGTWTIITGTGTFVNANDPATDITGLGVGDNVLVWTLDNGACGTTADTVHVTVFDSSSPDADAGAGQQICTPTTEATMAANAGISPAVGTWTLISGAGTIVSPHDPATVITGLQLGANVFQWSIDNGACGSTSSQVTITLFDGGLTTANAGPDQRLCMPANSATLAANAVTAPAVGTWTIVNGGTGTLSDPNDANATISGLAVGTVTLVWNISNGACTNQLTDTVTIRVYDNEAQAAAAGPDQETCVAGPTSAVMFSNTPVSPAVGTWSVVSGSGTIVDPNSPGAVIEGIGFGTNVYRWSIDNGACGTSSDEVMVAVFDANVAAAQGGPDQSFCQDTTTARMAAVPTTSTGTGAWSLLSGRGAIASPGDPATDITGLGTGMNVFAWTVSNGVCGTTSDTVIVELRDCTTLVVPDAYSPNGDGVNDIYVIRGLEYYPNNTFQVFNRWGSKVLDRSPYRNNWDGRSENSLNWGEELPESTYYYILDPGDGKDIITGYIYLRR